MASLNYSAILQHDCTYKHRLAPLRYNYYLDLSLAALATWQPLSSSKLQRVIHTTLNVH
jgi:hypothetical protein